MKTYWLFLLAMMTPCTQAQVQARAENPFQIQVKRQNLCKIEIVQKNPDNTIVQVKRITGELFLSAFSVKKDFSTTNYGALGCESIWVNLKNAKPSGRFQRYYKNGNVRNTYEYDKGMRTGQWHAFYVDGTIAGTVNYQNDQKNGELWLGFPDSQTNLRRNYVNGLAQGQETWWDERGRVVGIIERRNSKVVRHTKVTRKTDKDRQR